MKSFFSTYGLSLLLLAVFAMFLVTIEQTSTQIIEHFTGTQFHYEQDAFLKTFYIVMGVLFLATLLSIQRNEETPESQKKEMFLILVIGTVFSFFPGWIVHLYAVIRTLQESGSFMALERKFWLYNASDITMMLGFVIVGLLKVRPLIHQHQ